MVARFAQWTLDVHDVDRMAQFWSAVLGYTIDKHDDNVHLYPPDGTGPSVWLQPTRTPKAGKNRNHPDLIATDDNTPAELARLLSLGATHANVGQSGNEPFTVLTDPEGNEFCLLHHH